MNGERIRFERRGGMVAAAVTGLMTQPVMAQSVFDTGANAMVAWGLTIATPIAVLVVIGAGIAASVGKISWMWVIGGVVGIAVIFGSQQIVTWIRSMFGV